MKDLPNCPVLQFLILLLFGCGPLTSLASVGEDRLVVSLAGENRLDVFAIGESGMPTLQSQTGLTGSPGPSRFDHTGQNLYVGTSNPATISVFRTQSKGLKFLQSVAVTQKPSFMAVTPNGQFLVSACYANGEVWVHRILGEGRLSVEALQVIQTAPRTHGIAISPDGKFVFASHTQSNAIYQFRMDPSSGVLTANDPDRLQREANIGPRHLSFHPGGELVYGSDEQGRSISAYRFDTKRGTLVHLQTLASMPDDGTAKASTSDVEVHPSGKFVYIANRGHGSIAIFAIDTTTGRMKFIDRTPTAKVVRSFNLSEDGRFLTAAGQQSGRLIQFAIGNDGRLTELADVPTGKTPWWVNYYPAANVPDRFASTASVSDAKQSMPRDETLSLGQGTLTGEVTDSSALIQTRTTKGTQLDEQGDLPGKTAIVRFQWSMREDFADSNWTPLARALPERDFIVRAELTDLKPNTVYHYRPVFGVEESSTTTGETCSFRTLPGQRSDSSVRFIVGSCMNYIKFMHGREGKASGPLTATAEDKRLGFPAFESMKERKPDFFIGTGDIVYYDNPFRVATTKQQLRQCWHEQFRFPRMIEFFRNTPTYWSKDDHDFRFNDSDNESKRKPLPSTGIGLFHEQLPIAAFEIDRPKTYRTIRVNQHLQVWLTEGRDFRSANDSPDGPSKSMWGTVQRDWLKETLQDSDAKWKIIVSPTPLVGPDDGYKKDNHANLQGFRHEADAFFEWVNQQQLENSLILICGDRHWQYHSVHPSGVHEFACGALNDENSRLGVAPGDRSGSDPDGKVIQKFTSPEPSGGFLEVAAGEILRLTHFNDKGEQLYEARRTKPQSGE